MRHVAKEDDGSNVGRGRGCGRREASGVLIGAAGGATRLATEDVAHDLGALRIACENELGIRALFGVGGDLGGAVSDT